MGGVAGVMTRSGAPHTVAVQAQRMIAAIRHRGPDGCSVWSDGPAALANAWLKTRENDTPGPHLADDTGFAITADCRLDEPRDLAAALGLADTPVDAILILQAYRRWGEACVDRLTGDFAFALWDPIKKHFFCARDHFGVKPFYYHVSSGRFLFASEIKALSQGGGVAKAINERYVADFLVGMSAEPDATAYESIQRLPPAHILTVASQRLSLRRYWQLEPADRSFADDPAAEFRNLFERSVRSRIRGAGKVGAMLSGGLDSSSIVCVADRFATDRDVASIETFSLVYPAFGRSDERRYIDDIVAATNLRGHIVPTAEDRPLSNLSQMLDFQDGPFPGLGQSTMHLLYGTAAGLGTRVMLDGHGGDEVVSHGYGRLHELAAQGQWARLWRELRGVARLHDTPAASAYYLYYAKYGCSPLARTARRLARLMARSRLFLGRQRVVDGDDFLNPQLAARADVADRNRRRRSSAGTPLCETQLHLRALSDGMVADGFEALDKIAAPFGIEPRYPFWSRPLVEFCLSLPSDWKLRDGWSRFVLRQAMEGVLPHNVRWRADKADFGGHLACGMVRHHRALLDGILRDDAERIEPFLNVAAARKAWERVLRSAENAALDDIQRVWRSVALALWLERLDTAEAP